MRDLANTDVGRASLLHYRASEGDVMPPKKSSECDCPVAPEGRNPIYFYRDKHPSGDWCRSCGRVVK